MFIEKEYKHNEDLFSIGEMEFHLTKHRENIFWVDVYVNDNKIDFFQKCCSSFSYMKTICADYYWMNTKRNV